MPFTHADVETQYAKDEKLNRQDVKILLEWIETQPHLPQATELQAILFLHSCFGDLEMAKRTADNYFTMRTSWSYIFADLERSNMQQALSKEFVAFLPKQTPEGYDIGFTRLMDCSTENYNHLNQIKLFEKVFSLHLYQKGISNGFVLIIDMKGGTLGHATKVNLTAVKNYMAYVQEALPVRLKAIHLINAVSFIDTIITLIKPFVKSDFLNMITIHSGKSLETLFRCNVPQECLPEEYGGAVGPVAALHEANKKQLLDNFDLFVWQHSQKVDESKRTPAIKKHKRNNKSMQSGSTSFKKLEID